MTDPIALLHAACRAAYDAERWAETNPLLARLRRRDAIWLTAHAKSIRAKSIKARDFNPPR